MALGAIAPAAAEQPPPVESPAPIAVAVIDLRAGADDAARTSLLATLRTAGLLPLSGPIAAAYAGRDPDETAAAALLAEAQDAFGQLDCGRARPSAERAVLTLAARGAAGLPDPARLTRAWTYVALCAERDGDRSSAGFAIERLRALGAGPGAVPADLWARYPEIDAAPDRDIVELTVTGPAGAAAFVDDRAIGPVPARAFVPAGRHVIAVAAGPVRGATFATAFAQPLTIDVEAADTGGPIADVAAHVRRLQAARAIDAPGLAALLAHAPAELAVVVNPDGSATLWHAIEDEPPTVVVTGAEVEVAAAARRTWLEAHDRAPAAGEPLLREDDVPVRDARKAPPRWWVYAALGTVIVVGGVAIYAIDSGDDTQRFTLSF